MSFSGRPPPGPGKKVPGGGARKLSGQSEVPKLSLDGLKGYGADSGRQYGSSLYNANAAGKKASGVVSSVHSSTMGSHHSASRSYDNDLGGSGSRAGGSRAGGSRAGSRVGSRPAGRPQSAVPRAGERRAEARAYLADAGPASVRPPRVVRPSTTDAYGKNRFVPGAASARSSTPQKKAYGAIGHEDPDVFKGPNSPKPTRKHEPREFLRRNTGNQIDRRQKAMQIVALQDRPVTSKPPRSGAFLPRPAVVDSVFKQMYHRSDLPIIVEHGSDRSLNWSKPIEDIEIEKMLPAFCDGIKHEDEPYAFIATKGSEALIQFAGPACIDFLRDLVRPIKEALDTRRPKVVLNALDVLNSLVQCDLMHHAAGAGVKRKKSKSRKMTVGRALVPYFKMLLPAFNLLKNRSVNDFGEGMGRNTREANIGDHIIATLELFEEHGGVDALIVIKDYVPTYESCVFGAGC